jgi:uncharacterized membrane protein YkgB
MNALINATLNPIVGIARRSGLLTEDLDYHVIRASMIIMFFFFGYQKWWAYEADRLVPFISNGPLISWLYPVFGHQGACGLLGQTARHSRCRRFDRHIHRHRHNYSLHAGRLGRFGRRIPGHDG